MARQEPDASMTGLGWVTGPEGAWRYTGDGWEWMPSPESVQLALQKVAASPSMSPEEAYRFLASEGAVTGTRESMPVETAKALIAAGATPERASAIAQSILSGQRANEADYRGGDFFDVEGLTDVLKEDVIPFAATAAALYGGTAGLGALAGEGAAGAASAGGTAAETAGTSLGSGLTPGAGGVTGLTPGTTATGIGGGAVGTGITTPIATTSPWALSNLAPLTAGGTLASTLGGASAGGTAATAGGAMSRILDGTATAADWLELAGRAAPAVLGAVASNRQADAYSDLADKYMGIGAPSRARYEASFAPGFSMEADPGYKAALDQAAKATLHGLSVTGNPADSPNAWARSLSDLYEKTAYPALQTYRNQNAATGGFGAFSTAAPSAAGSSIGAQRGIYDAIGAGAADVFNPPRRLEDILREVRRAGY